MHTRVRPHFTFQSVCRHGHGRLSLRRTARGRRSEGAPRSLSLSHQSPLSRQCWGRPSTIHSGPQVLNNHKGHTRGRGLCATATPPVCGLTFWNAFHSDLWLSYFNVHNFHRSINPTVSLLQSTNGFSFLPCPFSELF